MPLLQAAFEGYVAYVAAHWTLTQSKEPPPPPPPPVQCVPSLVLLR